MDEATKQKVIAKLQAVASILEASSSGIQFSEEAIDLGVLNEELQADAKGNKRSAAKIKEVIADAPDITGLSEIAADLDKAGNMTASDDIDKIKQKLRENSALEKETAKKIREIVSVL